jgi:hypothetical protein
LSWPFDTSKPFITPGHGTEFQRRRHGLTPEEWALPPTLVATFQRDAYRLLERGGVDARNSADRAVGEVDVVPCALTRIGIGAPATALLLEDSVARGVRSILVVGSAGSLQRHLPIGSTVIVTGAEREDGTSHSPTRYLKELGLIRTTGTTGTGMVGMFLITPTGIRLVESLRAAG